MAALYSNPVLSEMHLAIHSAVVPVYPYMLGIRPAGNNETRTAKRTLLGNKKTAEMPSVGR